LVTDATHENLLAFGPGTPPAMLPVDPAVTELAQAGPERLTAVVSAHPESSLCWALLAERSLQTSTPEGDIAAYAYARTGYHRGLDSLRRAGWKGSGPIPWEHAPNQGFLRALYALAVAAGRIGDDVEHERCLQFLRDSSETAYAELTRQSAVAPGEENEAVEGVR
jgi:hypothetical protein